MKKLIVICLGLGIISILQSCVSTGGGVISSSLSPTSTLTSSKPFVGKRVALVIGNNRYHVTPNEVPPLGNPVNDATDIAHALKNLGFEVILKTDANKQVMETAIKEFNLKSKEARISLLYYSGHGMQNNGENFLLPIDFNGDTNQPTIQATLVQQAMQDSTNGTKIMILDACRNNSDADTEQGGAKSVKGQAKKTKGALSTKTGLAHMTAHREFIIMYATAAGTQALDGTGKRNSPYAEALLKHLNDPIPIENLTTVIANTVVRSTTPPPSPLKEPQAPAAYHGGLTSSFCFTDCGTNLLNKPTENLCKLKIGQGFYEGECQDGKANGQGVQRYADGEYYTGSFKNNIRNGYGTQYLKDGKNLTGSWNNGRLVGK